ncbi:unnamed protein product [Orchesella dallaii]|uniref:Methyltransferase type 12 domain-containing protein n=1 Tax=Orchesella dallaii TaxID=48710 RepID=A0ABP1PR64_9HEXA
MRRINTQAWFLVLKNSSPSYENYSNHLWFSREFFLRNPNQLISRGLALTRNKMSNESDLPGLKIWSGQSSESNSSKEQPMNTGESSEISQELKFDDDPICDLMQTSYLSSESESDERDKTRKSKKVSKYAILKQKNEENKKLWKEVTKSGTVKVPFPKPKIVRSRNLTDTTAVFQCNAWDDVEWDEDMKKQAMEVVCAHSKTTMNDERKEVLENEAYKFWDDFYGNHKNKFFRDRNWLYSEFPELESPFGGSVDPEFAAEKLQELRIGESYPGENSKFKVLEVGCGVGNTVFPLLSTNNHPQTYVYCCDFSPQAIDLVRNNAEFDSQRCTPFVLDITEENPVIPFKEGSVDVITAIFVVSAISPSKFKQAVRNFNKFLKPGGLVLFRDYGRYDLAQLRFKDGRCIEENFYVRGDGTRVYFFTEDELELLFLDEGFDKQSLYVDRRLQVNRGKQLKMYRVWVQAKFRKKTVV